MARLKYSGFIWPNKISDKVEIVNVIEEYLKENSIADITSIINDICPPSHIHSAFVRDIANRMRLTGKYEIEEKGGYEGPTYLVRHIPRKSWRERNPLWNEVIIAFITAAFSLIVGWLLFRMQNRVQDQIDKQQNERMDRLSDSLNTIEKKLADSAHKTH